MKGREEHLYVKGFRDAVQTGPSREPAEAQNETDPIYILPWIGDLGGTCDWGECDEPAVAKRWDVRHGWLPVCEAHKDSDDA